MIWLKRNLFLVVGIAVAVGLLGFALFYLIRKMKQNDDVTTQLKDGTTELNRLVTRKTHPDEQNIKAAKEEEKKLEAFLVDVQQHFPPLVLPEKLTDQTLGYLLDTTIARLQHDARQNGVELTSTNYSFTFAIVKNDTHFPAPEELASRLIEINALSEILFHAKINKLVGLKRAPVSKETGTGNDYLSAKPVTNQWTIATPYEASFDGFSSELADVLEGLVNSKLCFVVNNIVAEPASTAATDTDTSSSGSGSESIASQYMRRYGRMMTPPTQTREPDSSPAARYGGPGMGRFGGDSRMRGMNPSSRYGGRGPGLPPGLAERYHLQPAPGTPPPSQRPIGRGGMVQLVDENLLRFTLTLQVVKYRAPEKATEGKSLAKATNPRVVQEEQK